MEGNRGRDESIYREDGGNGGLQRGSTEYTAVDNLQSINDEIESKLNEAGIKFPAVRVVRVNSKDFHDAIAAGKAKNENGWRVDVKEAEDYDHCVCLLTADGHAGIAVKEDGDIVSLFSDNAHPGVSRKLILMAIANGGRKADFFMTPNDPHGLQNLYWRFGLTITGTTPFDVEFMESEYGNPDWVAYRETLIQQLGDEEGHKVAANHPLAAGYFPDNIEDAIKAFKERKNKIVDGQLADVSEFLTEGDDFGYDKMMTHRDRELERNLQDSKKSSTFAAGNEQINNGGQEYDLRHRNREILSERFRDEELQGCDGLLSESEAYLQRGGHSSSPETQTSKSANKELADDQEFELEDFARKKGVWIDNTSSYLREKYGEPECSLH